jgi:F0F1-type ATP synthase assembly protein I
VTGWLGWWLDEKLGTSPWLLLVGIFLGASGGFYSLVRRVGTSEGSPGDRNRPTTPPESTR